MNLSESQRRQAGRMGILVQYKLSDVLATMLELIAKITERTFTIADIRGTHDIRRLATGVFRGDINVGCLWNTKFSRINFCLTECWGPDTWKLNCSTPQLHPHGSFCRWDSHDLISGQIERTTVILGYHNPYIDEAKPCPPNPVSNEVRLLVKEKDQNDFEERELEDRRDPVLWGGKVPNWLRK